jgi:hypothetical protein
MVASNRASSTCPTWRPSVPGRPSRPKSRVGSLAVALQQVVSADVEVDGAVVDAVDPVHGNSPRPGPRELGAHLLPLGQELVTVPTPELSQQGAGPVRSACDRHPRIGLRELDIIDLPQEPSASMSCLSIRCSNASKDHQDDRVRRGSHCPILVQISSGIAATAAMTTVTKKMKTRMFASLSLVLARVVGVIDDHQDAEVGQRQGTRRSRPASPAFPGGTGADARRPRPASTGVRMSE